MQGNVLNQGYLISLKQKVRVGLIRLRNHKLVHLQSCRSLLRVEHKLTQVQPADLVCPGVSGRRSFPAFCLNQLHYFTGIGLFGRVIIY
jgi:hypothetical protein